METNKRLMKRDPMVVSALTKMMESGGSLTPKRIVDEARSSEHPLHGYFEWDDSKAGEKFRRLQAYQLLAAQRQYIVLTKGVTKEIYADAEKLSVRAILPTRSGNDEYVSRDDAKNDPIARARIVEAFRAELKAWYRRTVDFTELRAERTAIGSVLGIEVSEKAKKKKAA